MLNKLRHIILIAALALGVSATFGATHSIKASLDSAHLLMGRVTPLHLEIVEDVNNVGTLALTGDTLCKEVEILAASQPDTTDLGNNRRQINLDLILQSFDSGMYNLPPIPYISGKDTMFTKPLTLKVMPVLVDSLTTIHGYADTVEGESKWYDFLPNWIVDYWGWIVVGLLLVAGGVVAYLLLSGKAKKILPEKKPVPPYEFAINALNALHERHLCDNGQEREYYTILTEILREYLERRFGINAMEMTSSQILETLQNREETRIPKAHMKQILEIADFVKFAKMRPLPDDNVKAFNSAIQFVEDTKPVEVPAEDDDEEKANPTNKEQK